MSNEQSIEETKSQPAEIAALGDIIRKLLHKVVEWRIEAMQKGCAPEPMRFSGKKLGGFPRVHTYVVMDAEGEIDLGTILVTSEHHASIDEEQEQSIRECFAQIDQSREQAQSTQVEIDQLRTETREFISKLLAA
jgi:hypothetical protein